MRKGAQTRQAIIEQAAAIFNQRGFEGGSLSDLMQATGLQKGGIYRHFASKEELAVAAFRYMWGQVSKARLAGTGDVPHSLDRLQQFVRTFARPLGRVVPGGCPLLNTAVDADHGNPALREEARRALRTLVGRLRRVIENGQAKGEIQRHANPAELATVIVASLEGALMMSGLSGNRRSLGYTCAHLVRELERLRA